MTDTLIDRTPADRVDVCVVGAGVAGGLVAHSLARRGRSVVLLDAGPRFDVERRRERMATAIRPSHDPPDVWDMGGPRDRYTSETPTNVGCRLNHQRVKGIGGTTLHWGGHSLRLHRKDFEMNSRYGLAVDWPIGYDDLRPYYAAAETELGVAGADDNPFGPPRQIDYPMEAFPPSEMDSVLVDACDRLDITTHSIPQARNTSQYDGRSQCLGYSTCIPVCPSGAKYSGDVHVRKAEEAGARVIDSAPVQRLEHGSDGERVREAVYATPDGEVYRQEARQFVAACGGVETPRLLLLSASAQHPDGLANRSGLVGSYFHSHSYVSVRGRLPEPLRREPVGVARTESQQFYDHDTRGPGSIRLLFGTNNSPSPARVALSGGIDSPVEEMSAGARWGDDLLGRMRDSIDYRGISVVAVVETLPRRSNAVSLDESTVDDHGNPVPKITYDVGDHSIAAGESALEILREVIESTGATVTNVSDPTRQNVGNHHMGTTRMGTDSDRSVLNPHGRAHDLSNLWVASSSVFPTGGAVNPTLTIAALSLRLADDLHATLDGEHV